MQKINYVGGETEEEKEYIKANSQEFQKTLEDKARLCFMRFQAPAVRRWTDTAIFCCKRGCNCARCFYTEFFANSKTKCHMKSFVLKSVRVLGAPKNVEIKQVLEE